MPNFCCAVISMGSGTLTQTEWGSIMSTGTVDQRQSDANTLIIANAAIIGAEESSSFQG